MSTALSHKQFSERKIQHEGYKNFNFLIFQFSSLPINFLPLFVHIHVCEEAIYLHDWHVCQKTLNSFFFLSNIARVRWNEAEDIHEKYFLHTAARTSSSLSLPNFSFFSSSSEIFHFDNEFSFPVISLHTLNNLFCMWVLLLLLHLNIFFIDFRYRRLCHTSREQHKRDSCDVYLNNNLLCDFYIKRVNILQFFHFSFGW